MLDFLRALVHFQHDDQDSRTGLQIFWVELECYGQQKNTPIIEKHLLYALSYHIIILSLIVYNAYTPGPDFQM